MKAPKLTLEQTRSNVSGAYGTLYTGSWESGYVKFGTSMFVPEAQVIAMTDHLAVIVGFQQIVDRYTSWLNDQ